MWKSKALFKISTSDSLDQCTEMQFGYSTMLTVSVHSKLENRIMSLLADKLDSTGICHRFSA